MAEQEEMVVPGKIKVFDHAGVERLVDPVDAREIIAHGGTTEAFIAPLKEKAKAIHPAEAKAPAKSSGKAK
jgi:hypothetical protein